MAAVATPSREPAPSGLPTRRRAPARAPGLLGDGDAVVDRDVRLSALAGIAAPGGNDRPCARATSTRCAPRSAATSSVLRSGAASRNSCASPARTRIPKRWRRNTARSRVVLGPGLRACSRRRAPGSIYSEAVQKSELDAIMRQGIVLPETPRQRREKAALEEDLRSIPLAGKPLPIRARGFRPSAEAYLLATRGPLPYMLRLRRDRAADGGLRGAAANGLAHFSPRSVTATPRAFDDSGVRPHEVSSSTR